MFSEDNDQSLVALRCERIKFCFELFLTQRLSDQLRVLGPETAVRTVVDAVVSNVKRCEENDPVALDLLFQLSRRLKYELDLLWFFCVQERGCFFGCETFFFQRLLNDLLDQLRIKIPRLIQQLFYLTMRDETLSILDTFDPLQ